MLRSTLHNWTLVRPTAQLNLREPFPRQRRSEQASGSISGSSQPGVISESENLGATVSAGPQSSADLVWSNSPRWVLAFSSAGFVRAAITMMIYIRRSSRVWVLFSLILQIVNIGLPKQASDGLGLSIACRNKNAQAKRMPKNYRRCGALSRALVANGLAVRLRFARTALRIVITVALVGVAAPACGFPMLPPRTANPDSGTEEVPFSKWVSTTDPPSNISVLLPNKPTVKNTTTTDGNGATVPLRQYLVGLSDGRGEALFQVVDAPDRIIDLDKSVQSMASGVGSEGTVTSNRHFDLDGHPAVDARCTSTIDGSLYVVLLRLISDRGYMIMVATDGPIAQEGSLNRTHQQILQTLRIA